MNARVIHPTKHRLDDLQGLRAIAVISVVLFHLWPSVFPGGYVGVDIFFVISGFLMTSLLLKEVEAFGRINLFDFFIRRIRRLVPAAAAVIVVVALASPLLPSTKLSLTAQEIVASALFVENWLLLSRAVDYSASDQAAGVLQHYWSLGVEGQFYVIWPLVLMAATYISTSRKVLTRILLVLLVVGFALSVWLSYRDPPAAYFATHVRFWEFVVGGVVAAAHLRNKLPHLLASILAWGSLLAIAATVMLLTRDVPFPGWVALIPCLAAALLIATGSAPSLAPVLTFRPVTYIGDISYSVYLWHWPLIVFWQSASPTTFGLTAKVAIILLSVALAAASKVLVEDPFRRPWNLSAKAQSAIAGAGITFFTIGTAIVPLGLLLADRNATTAETTTGSQSNSNYPGALALTDGATVPYPAPPPRPSPEFAMRDMPIANRDGCQVFDSELRSCDYGRLDGPFHIVVVGDSHAAQFSDAFEMLARQRGWRYTHMSKAQCPFIGETIIHPRKRQPFVECDRWNEQALGLILDLQPDLVVPIQSWKYPLASGKEGNFERRVSALASRWEILRQQGIGVIPIRDTPTFGHSAPECIAQGRDDCDRDRNKVTHPASKEEVVVAAKRLGLPVIDVTDGICDSSTCRAVVGNIIAWRDASHLTATYVRTLAPYLGRLLDDAMKQTPKEER
ncbi:acyltransferase family protein [Microbaculum sp. FT89]|uniref:acyltransferase family protein n=1 Tax=Microbaculum sp. FT89 TaxID=3447298 RepID=UPI003F5317E0